MISSLSNPNPTAQNKIIEQKMSRGIRTLSDLNRPSGDDSDSDSDAPQEYYTGGEKSGMIVQDPQKGKDVDSIFDQARQLGALQGPLENLQSSQSSSFTGTGRVLSGETVPTAQEQQQQQQPESIVHNIIFWRNGFSVNDGPLRRLDDPANAPFLESITRSECPNELEPADKKSSVHVNLIRKDENHPEPEVRSVPFQGVGRILGSSSSTTEWAPEAATVAAPLQSLPTPSTDLVMDKSQPSTSIQIRLADGTRMVEHFNYHHTVADIRNFIDALRPERSRTYQLQTVGFPPKVLSDHSQTIEEAGLLNSVVIQKN